MVCIAFSIEASFEKEKKLSEDRCVDGTLNIEWSREDFSTPNWGPVTHEKLASKF